MTDNVEPVDGMDLPRRKLHRKGIVLIAIVLAVGLGGAWIGIRWHVQQLRDKSRQASEERDWKKLEAVAGEWSAWEPDATEAWVLLADAAQNQNRFHEAVSYLGHVPEDDPGYVNVLIARSHLFFGPCNSPLEGEADCLKVLRMEPQSPAAYEMLITYYAITMQASELRKTIRQAIDNRVERPSAYAYLFMSETLRLGPAYRVLSLWLNEIPDSELLTVAHALQKDNRLIQTGDPVADRKAESEKVQRVRDLLRRYPQNLNLLSYDIQQRMVEGDVDGVIDLLEAAGERGLADNRIWRLRAWVHLTENDVDAAASACLQALELHPLDFLAIQQLSEVERVRRNLDEADRLQNLVLRANELRDIITDHGQMDALPEELLKKLAGWFNDTGDRQAAEALGRRVSQGEPSKTEDAL